MKTIRKAVILSTIAALAAGTLALTTALQAAPPVRSSKRVVLDCDHGWRAGAGGNYGGVPFDVSCSNGKSQTMLTGTVGTTYSIRMGVENGSIGADCAYSGDAATIKETCVAVGLSIR